MKNRKSIPQFKTIEVIILVLLTFCISFLIGMILGKKNVYITDSNNIDNNVQGFIENYKYILKNYYKDVDEKKLINGAIKGMVESLDDEYSVYFEDTQTNTFNATLDGEYEGLGIEYYKDLRDNSIVISGVFKDSPAYKAGLKVNDIILSVDDKDFSTYDLNKLSEYIFNSKQKTFLLKIKRNDEVLDINLSKDRINIESITSDIYEKEGRKIGYIYISIFANNTDKQFKTHLENLESQGIDSLIIDVRQNSGGHLLSVENILQNLLTDKQVVYMMDFNGKITKTYGKLKKNKNYEIVLLGDSGSASASEVLISSLKENLNCYFIGEKTFGKGTVQELVQLSNGSQYKITTNKWLTPNGNWINSTKGILPDIQITLDKKYIETGNVEDDNQLQTTIKYLVDKK